MSRPGTRAQRFAITLLGLLLAAEGAGKLADPHGYLEALARFDALPESWLRAAATAWMAVELAAGAGLAYAGLASRPSRRPSLAAAFAGLAAWLAYAALLYSAYVRKLAIADCTFFGAFVPARLSLWPLAQLAILLALASFEASRIARWPNAK
ncbi:MAG TPA: MauE/DoxX family redox-associated membrane protein [Polyangia bacterium]|nr:MauE/DoxX family redox-associated membrane protein [Polyangia bacterium]